MSHLSPQHSLQSLIHVPVDISHPMTHLISRFIFVPQTLFYPFLTSILSSPSCVVLLFSLDKPCCLSYRPNALCVSPRRSLDLTGPLFLGGVPNVPDNFPFGAREFIGCIKEFHIDSKPLDLAGFIANNGTVAGQLCLSLTYMCIISILMFFGFIIF